MAQHPLTSFFDSSFWDPFPTIFSNGKHRFAPSADIAETDKEITVSLDVPGFDPKDIDVTIEKGVLTIQGKMQEEREEKDKKWHCKQCASGSFFQQFTLPSSINEAGVICKAKNGKLTVSVPKKSEEKSAGRRLTIDIE